MSAAAPVHEHDDAPTTEADARDSARLLQPPEVHPVPSPSRSCGAVNTGTESAELADTSVTSWTGRLPWHLRAVGQSAAAQPRRHAASSQLQSRLAEHFGCSCFLGTVSACA